jgi:hypothetical protein
MLPLSPGRGESCEFVFDRGSSVHQKCSRYTQTNLLFGLCRSMWIINPRVTHFSLHSGAPARPSTPRSAASQECVPIICLSFVFTFGLEVEFIQEFEGVSITMFHTKPLMPPPFYSIPNNAYQKKSLLLHKK